jgi:hypothetical protein
MRGRTLLILAMLSVLLWGAYGFLYPERSWHERDYQRRFCREHGGRMEVRLSDHSRVDCLTDRYAVEVEYGRKWAEGAGQALYYALQTGKRPAVALIVGSGLREKKYLKRLEALAGRYGIHIYTIDKE